MQLRHARGALDEQGQLAARAPRRDGLQRRSTGEHQADDRAGELLIEGERTEHRDQGDRVDPEVAIDHHGADHLEGELGGEQCDGGAPDLMAGFRGAERVQQEARSDRHDGDRSEDLRSRVGQPPQRCSGAREPRRGRGHRTRMAPARRGGIRGGPRYGRGRSAARWSTRRR
ncbi:hypothetical protein [Paraconexibacter antarcticus]|uniref:hypothetical protein n=1 Tax=Paraconexibacter antarcticus TaxID=2949664 RepID=UPI00345F28D5